MVYEAKPADSKQVEEIIRTAIAESVPQNLSEETANFLLKLHNKECIKEEILHKNVYLLESNGYLIGTGTLSNHEIKRVFILPQYQGQHFGTELVQCLEDELAVNELFTAVVYAYEQVKSWYGRMGYVVTGEQPVEIGGEKLLLYRMEKQVAAMNMEHFYHGFMF